jgi:hypothetical protein
LTQQPIIGTLIRESEFGPIFAELGSMTNIFVPDMEVLLMEAMALASNDSSHGFASSTQSETAACIRATLAGALREHCH